MESKKNWYFKKQSVSASLSCQENEGYVVTLTFTSLLPCVSLVKTEAFVEVLRSIFRRTSPCPGI